MMLTLSGSFSISDRNLQEPLLEVPQESRPSLWQRCTRCFNTKKFGGALTLLSAAGMAISPSLTVFKYADVIVHMLFSTTLGFGIQHLCFLRYPKGIEGAIQLDPPEPNRNCLTRVYDKALALILKANKYYAHPVSRAATMIAPISTKAKFSMIFSFAGMFTRIKLQAAKNGILQKKEKAALPEINKKHVIIDVVFSVMGGVTAFELTGRLIDEYSREIIYALGIDLMVRPVGFYLLRFLDIKTIDLENASRSGKTVKKFKLFLDYPLFPIGSGFIIYTFVSPTGGMALIGIADGSKNWIYMKGEMKKIIREEREELNPNAPCLERVYDYVVNSRLANNFATIALLGFMIQDIIDPDYSEMPYESVWVIAPGLFAYYSRKVIRLSTEQIDNQCKAIAKKLLIEISDLYLQEMIWLSLLLSNFDMKVNPDPYKASLFFTGLSIGISQEELLNNKGSNRATPSTVRWGALADFPALLK